VSGRFRVRRFIRSRVVCAGVLVPLLISGTLTTPTAEAAVVAPANKAPHAVALLVSPRVNRPTPKVPAGAGGSSTGLSRPAPKPVSEIVADRTATSATWKNSDGSITVKDYAAPHFYKPSATTGWTPITTALSAVAGQSGRWRSGANSWQASFGPAASSGGAEQISTGGTQFGFTPEGVTSLELQPSVSGSTATYAGLWPDTNLTEQVTSNSVAEDLVLTNSAAASSYTFDLSGATAVANAAGGLSLVANGKTVGTVPAPTVSTANGQGDAPGTLSGSTKNITKASGARYTLVNGRVQVSVSRAWLASLPKAAYPVVIDPSYQPPDSGVTSADAFTFSGTTVAGEVQAGRDSDGNYWDGAAYFSAPTLQATPAGTEGWEMSSAWVAMQFAQTQTRSSFFLYYDGASRPTDYADVLSGTLVPNATESDVYSAGISGFVGQYLQGTSGGWFGLSEPGASAPLVTGSADSMSAIVGVRSCYSGCRRGRCQAIR